MLNLSGTVLFWLVLVIVFAVAEGVTAALVSVWFAVGAVAALITAALTDSLLVQVIVFLLVSIAVLALMRPLMKSRMAAPPAATNADRNIGRTATVLVTVTPDMPGRVRLDGVDWAARSAETLAKDARCIVLGVDGATLTVCSEAAARPQPAVALSSTEPPQA